MQTHTVTIAGKVIGDDHPCFITAEAGSNHNKNLEQAKKLIDVAVAARADAVKFQTFRASKTYTENAGYADYLGAKKSICEIVREMEMPYEWIAELARYCDQRSIVFFSAPFDEESVDILEPHVPCFKIASYEATHLPLVKYIAKKGKPIILSLGVTSFDETREALDTIVAAGNKNVILQHCIASYPAPLRESNLAVIQTLKREFGVPAGLSDHTREPLPACLGAVALGANIVEKHFTLSNTLPGPDHAYALEPHELATFVQEIRAYEARPVGYGALVKRFPDLAAARGDGIKRIMPAEQELYHFARRSIFAIRPIAAGDTFTPENTAVLRNGKNVPGLAPREYERLLGKRARNTVAPFVGIAANDIE